MVFLQCGIATLTWVKDLDKSSTSQSLSEHPDKGVNMSMFEDTLYSIISRLCAIFLTGTTFGPAGWKGKLMNSLTWSHQQPTVEWQAEKTSLCIRLHCFCDQACRYGLVVQGLLMLWASGQLGKSFQLFPNTSGLTTTALPLVVKSLFALPS